MIPISFAIATTPDGLFRRLTIANAAELNHQVMQSEPGCLVVARSEPILEQLKREELLRFDESSIALFPLRGCTETAEDWSDLPAAIAVRCAPPEAAAIVAIPVHVLISSARNAAPFRDVSRPIWDWIMRQIDEGRAVQVRDACAIASGEVRCRPRLVPRSNEASRDWLKAHLLDTKLIDAPQSAADVVALRAGLLQMHDLLDASHQQSQSIEGEGRHAAGDYWHGIMHRREPDYDNARYWFRRVGPHPLFKDLARCATTILGWCADPESRRWQQRLLKSNRWDPFSFVDFCETCSADEDGPLGVAAREIQWQEMRLLLRHTYRDAIGND